MPMPAPRATVRGMTIRVGRTIVGETADRLLRAGVSAEDAERLLMIHGGDMKIALEVVPLPGEPREGDRLRLSDGRTAMEVLGVAPAAAIETAEGPKTRWAVVGALVPISRADAEVMPRGLSSGP